MKLSVGCWLFICLITLLLLSSCEEADGDTVTYPLDREAVENFFSEADFPLKEIVDLNSKITSVSSTHLFTLTDGTFNGYLVSSLYGKKDPALFLSYDVPVEHYATDAAFLEHEISRLFEYTGFLYDDGGMLIDAQLALQNDLRDKDLSDRMVWKGIRDGQFLAVTVYLSTQTGSYHLDVDIRTETAHDEAVRELAAEFSAQEVTVKLLHSITAPSPPGEASVFWLRGKLHISQSDRQSFDNNLSARLPATLVDATGAIDLYVDNGYFQIDTWEEERDHLIFYDGNQYLYILDSVSVQ